ncbi:MAG: NTP transferase domain-containing protein [Candidatus Margulisbacteria bacterium]|nr:NTP transferase domain-containing protein [Candidatus Margulisiibacteriota bacterium]
MKAILLAGGFGTRLHPLTVNRPKPMVPLVNEPLMSYSLRLLAKHGFTEITALLHHQPEIIKNYFGDGSQFDLQLTYVEAPADYGTAGAVRYACQGEPGPVLVISADLLTEIDLLAAIDFHRARQSLATMVLTRVADPSQFGIVITDKSGQIKQFLEKPSSGEVFSDTINAGIYLLEPEVLNFIPAWKKFDFSLDLFPLLLKKEQPLFGFVGEELWEDIGQIDDYLKVHHKFALKHPASRIIGADCEIAEQVKIARSVIGPGCKIAKGAVIEESVLWAGVKVEEGARIFKSVLGSKVKVGARANLHEGVVVGDSTEIGADSEIRPFIKIWPDKVIGEGSTVSRSVIWREHWARSIFGQYGVTGICGVEVTPQFAAALGAAYGSTLAKGSCISASRDEHKASRMIYRGLVAGILSAGIDIANLEAVPIPVNRFDIRSLKSRGGFHVRKSPFDPELIDIRFFDSHGLDLSSAAEKEVERFFCSENFTRTSIEETGELSYPFHRLAAEYRAQIMEHFPAGLFGLTSMKAVIDYSFGSASQIFPSILGDLGLEIIALNAYIDETKITKDKETFEKSWQQMARIVQSTGSSLGVMLDTGAEKIFLCDEQGRIIGGDQSLAIMALMTFDSNIRGSIAVPVTASSIMEELAEKYNGRIVRAKNNSRDLMEKAESKKFAFLGERSGGYIFPAFLPAFDGLFSVCQLIKYLAEKKIKLSELLAEVPAINIKGADLSCLMAEKGKVMRRAFEQIKGVDKVETIDGLKFWHGPAWVLLQPDPTRPLLRLLAEASSNKKAEQLLEKYVRIVESLKEE